MNDRYVHYGHDLRGPPKGFATLFSLMTITYIAEFISFVLLVINFPVRLVRWMSNCDHHAWVIIQ